MPNPHKLPLPKMYLKCIDKLKRVDEAGKLYYLEYKPNYYFLEKYATMLTKPSCSSFTCLNDKGEHLFGRNYDFVHYKNNDREKGENTSLNVLVRCKNFFAKYESLAMCDAFWLDLKKGSMIEGSLDDGKSDVSGLALVPFLTMDGINEKGLAVSIMQLMTKSEWVPIEYRDPETFSKEEKRTLITLEKPGEEPQEFDRRARPNSLAVNVADKKLWKADKHFAVHQNAPHRKSMFHPILMRRMLDYCKNVDEAVKLAKKTNVVSPLPTDDYHIMITDKSGKTVVLEWIENELIVNTINHATNFIIAKDDHYGYGEDRDEKIVNALKKGALKDEEAVKLLGDVAQDFRKDPKTGFTIWSCLYNLDKLSLKVYLEMDYSKEYEFKL